jgi:hypothetical protein
MKTGVKMEQENVLRDKVVYLAIPKRLYNDAIVTRAHQYIKTLKPLAIIDPRGMFTDNAEWMENFPKYLKPVSAVVVITDNRFIGKGVYEEVWYCMRQNVPIYHYVEIIDQQSVRPVTAMNIVNWNNWIDYAQISTEVQIHNVK